MATDQTALKSAQTPRCLTCTRPARVRGLCPACRSAAWRAVAGGSATEMELMDHGLLLPRKSGGRPPKCGFAEQLARLRRADAEHDRKNFSGQSR